MIVLDNTNSLEALFSLINAVVDESSPATVRRQSDTVDQLKRVLLT